MRPLVEKLWVRRLLSLLTLATVWELLARRGILDPFYAPPPSEILRVVYSLCRGRILSHLEATLPPPSRDS
jgi:NitT/TauT family transport system permease protein